VVALRLVIDHTPDPMTWLIVTGWEATDGERKILGAQPNEHVSLDRPRTAAGDFDKVLATVDPRYIERHRGNPKGKERILRTVEGEDAERLQRIAAARGPKPTDLVAELLRDADRPAA
jgi:hypothetical protein